MPLGILITIIKLPIDYLNFPLLGLVIQGFRTHSVLGFPGSQATTKEMAGIFEQKEWYLFLYARIAIPKNQI